MRSRRVNHLVSGAPVFPQRAFACALQDPGRDAPTGLRVAPGVDARRRFDVHRNNAVIALVDALASAFPVTAALVGEDFFRAMARERLRIDPPRSPVLIDYGDGFADFIAGFEPAASVPYLADMARLEQMRVRAYHAADAMPVATAIYQTLVDKPACLAATRLRLHPACHWLQSRHAVWSIWQAHQDVGDMRDAGLDAIRIDTAEAALVTRPQWDVLVTALPADGCTWLAALRDGMTLGEAAVQAHGGDETTLVPRLESLFALIVRHGLAVALDPPPE